MKYSIIKLYCSYIMSVIHILLYYFRCYHNSSQSTEGLDLKISRIDRYSQDTKRIGMAKATLPALDSDDSCARTNKSHSKCIAKTKANAVINVSLPLVGLYATRLRIPEGITSTV